MACDRSPTHRRRQTRKLNDAFRRTTIGGKLVVTHGVAALGAIHVLALVDRVRNFADFSEANDPHGEHDFGAFEDSQKRFFWKIDYYDEQLHRGSEDPRNPAKTTRVLTLMLADEY
jgi:hypothetical protein